MKNRELFKAVTGQCAWCREQWPVRATEGRMLHVGPYTRDLRLFFAACDAKAIREAFEYTGYDGGKKVVWEARTPARLKKAHAKAPGTQLTMNVSSPKNRRFWRGPIEATLSVAKWPDWMRSGEPVSEERQQRCRDELRLMDEMDYWVQQPCTGPQYRKAWNKENTNLLKPACNWGFGCAACWDAYEKAYDELSKNWGDY